MKTVLLDTHALLWLGNRDKKLGPGSVALADEAIATGDLLVAAISFWEGALLHRRRRISLPASPAMWRQTALRAGIIEAPIDGEVAVLAEALVDLHADPADRLIIATALRRSATLMTADEKILGWPGKLSRFDARR